LPPRKPHSRRQREEIAIFSSHAMHLTPTNLTSCAPAPDVLSRWSANVRRHHCRRRACHPRNAATHALHGYLSRDGLPPAELLRIGRSELTRYRVDCRDAVVESACRDGDGFAVKLADGTQLQSRMLLVATGTAIASLKSTESPNSTAAACSTALIATRGRFATSRSRCTGEAGRLQGRPCPSKPGATMWFCAPTDLPG
jgi:hypothetical protein